MFYFLLFIYLAFEKSAVYILELTFVLGCLQSNKAIREEEKSTLKSETSEDEFHCQKLCSLIPECKIFHWNRSNQLCNLFSTLRNGNSLIVEESDSVVGQPDCSNMDPEWPENLSESKLTRLYFR